jgi:large subunit ribosomal protein L29
MTHKELLQDLRKKTDSELQDELQRCRQALYKLRFRKVTDVIEDASEFKKLKRQIARILTVIRERELHKAKGEGAV